MKFYDIGMQSNLSGGESSIAEIIDFSEKFGFTGVVICDKPDVLNQLKETIDLIKTDIEIYPGVIIEAKNPQELRNMVNKIREEAVVIIVAGGEYDINRAACENPKVDILAHPEKGRLDNGLDEYCVKMASKNNVAIQVNFREILYAHRRARSFNLSHIAKNISLCIELNAPIILSSAARSKWDMRDPRELVAIGNVLGMELNKAFESIETIPHQIIEKNKARLKGKLISEGVEVVE